VANVKGPIIGAPMKNMGERPVRLRLQLDDGRLFEIAARNADITSATGPQAPDDELLDRRCRFPRRCQGQLLARERAMRLRARSSDSSARSSSPSMVAGRLMAVNQLAGGRRGTRARR
jgi:uncharacterized protein involved in type VI secretion and phage assembly